MKNGKNRSVLAALMASAAIALSVPEVAMAQSGDTKYNFNIPAEDLGKALTDLARQSNREIYFSSDLTRGKRAPAVRGQMSAEEALGRMLAGSGLKHSVNGNGAITVTPQGNEFAGGATVGTESASSRGGRAVAEGQEGISEILVVGSRSQNVDIRRTEDDPQPYVVFSADEIKSSQASNVEDFFRKRLPMNTQGAANKQPTDFLTPNNIGTVNLRGLGTDETLILVDGRRMPRVQPANANSRFTQADINSIPIEAIERIEVLPSTAGAIYGGGATGGVINIIRKRDYKGASLLFGFESPFRGGGQSYRLELSGGFSPDKGATQVSFSGSITKSSPLFAKDNELWERGRALYLERYDEYSALLGIPAPLFSGYTGNIVSTTGAPLTLKGTGQPLGSNTTFVPIGYAGISSDGGAGLIANAGSFNFELSNDAVGRRAPLLLGSRVSTFNLNIRRSLGPSIDLFFDGTVGDNFARNRFATAPTTISLPASATNNPFNQSISVTVPAMGLDRPNESRSRTLSASAGGIARLGDGWVATAEYNWSRSRVKSKFTNNSVLPASVTNAYRGGTLNPVRDVNAFPLDYDIFFTHDPNSRFGPTSTLQKVASARVSGSPFSLPGGKMALTALLEHRDEIASEYSSTTTNATGTTTTTVFPKRSQSVSSGYFELTAPIVSEANALPFLHAFELQASLRHDRYETTVANPRSYNAATPPQSLDFETSGVRSTNYTVAVRWAPAADVALRGSYATGFLPPSIHQLIPIPVTLNFAGQPDPKRGNVPIQPPFVQLTGGNPNLHPEDSKSYSFGVILTPQFAPGLRLSADYSRITKSGEIAPLPADIAFIEENFPDRIVRGALTAADQALGYTGGPIQILDLSSSNLEKTRIDAWDFQLDYDVKTTNVGDIHFYAIATHLADSARQVLSTSAPFDAAGFSDGPLRWRLTGGIEWKISKFDVGWNFQYYDGYNVERASFSAANNLFLVTLQSDERIPSQMYHDIYASYRVSSRSPLLKGVEFSVGIQNLFDHKPPPLALSLGSPAGSYSGYGDPRLRRYSFSLRKSI